MSHDIGHCIPMFPNALIEDEDILEIVLEKFRSTSTKLGTQYVWFSQLKAKGSIVDQDIESVHRWFYPQFQSSLPYVRFGVGLFRKKESISPEILQINLDIGEPHSQIYDIVSSLCDDDPNLNSINRREMAGNLCKRFMELKLDYNKISQKELRNRISKFMAIGQLSGLLSDLPKEDIKSFRATVDNIRLFK